MRKSDVASGEVEAWSIKSYIVAAQDLGYSEDVIKKLKKAKNAVEATRIMTTARENDIKRGRGWRK